MKIKGHLVGALFYVLCRGHLPDGGGCWLSHQYLHRIHTRMRHRLLQWYVDGLRFWGHMKRVQFLGDEQVISFIDWMGACLTEMEVHLVIPPSRRFVPAGLNIKTVGIAAVTAAYMWRTSGTDSGDWKSTRTRCVNLSNALRDNVAAGDHDGTLTAAWDIIAWGGGNKVKGAYPFLVGLGDNLVSYLRETKQAFTLATADTWSIVPPVKAMNSMLTKVHAFLSTDGLPIYDSRVAVAMATFVEAWRQETLDADLLADTPIPDVLHFPTVPSRNALRTSVLRRFYDARRPAHLSAYNMDTAMAWSSGKIRLGWLLEAILRQHPAMFAGEEGMAGRMRAVEAGLFMIGYDVKCLREFGVHSESALA